jgi:hypothetical protein
VVDVGYARINPKADSCHDGWCLDALASLQFRLRQIRHFADFSTRRVVSRLGSTPRWLDLDQGHPFRLQALCPGQTQTQTGAYSCALPLAILASRSGGAGQVSLGEATI